MKYLTCKRLIAEKKLKRSRSRFCDRDHWISRSRSSCDLLTKWRSPIAISIAKKRSRSTIKRSPITHALLICSMIKIRKKNTSVCLLTIFSPLLWLNNQNSITKPSHDFIVVEIRYTLRSLINAHVRLFNFLNKFPLYVLIKDMYAKWFLTLRRIIWEINAATSSISLKKICRTILTKLRYLVQNNYFFLKMCTMIENTISKMVF